LEIGHDWFGVDGLLAGVNGLLPVCVELHWEVIAAQFFNAALLPAVMPCGTCAGSVHTF